MQTPPQSVVSIKRSKEVDSVISVMIFVYSIFNAFYV